MTKFFSRFFAFFQRTAVCGTRRAIAIIVGLAAGWSSVATAGTAQSDIVIKLEVLAPLCKVTAPDGGDISVDFGDNINIDKIHDKIYNRIVYYKIDCGAVDITDKTVRLTLKGTPASFTTNSGVLQTDMENLGILISKDGSPVELNQPLTLKAKDDGMMSVIPAKNPAGALKPGRFSATATLFADYE